MKDIHYLFETGTFHVGEDLECGRLGLRLNKPIITSDARKLYNKDFISSIFHENDDS
jgi:hypothetical protein